MSYRVAYQKSYDEACSNHWQRRAYVYNQHHVRFEANVTTRKPNLVCQDCRGRGGETYIIAPEIGGPWEECNWCEGTGCVTPHQRGIWLRMKRAQKRGKQYD